MPSRPQRELTEFERLHAAKQLASRRAPVEAIGPEMLSFFKNAVQKRQTKLSKLAEVWGNLVPETLSAHCALEGFNRGTLTVTVDSSPHLFELKQLLLAGLEQQLLLACKSAGLRKIVLRVGRWYDGESADGPDARPRFG